MVHGEKNDFKRVGIKLILKIGIDMNYTIVKDDIESIDSCPICECSEVILVARAKVLNVEYFRTCCCENCGFVFRDRRPKLDWFMRNWNLRDETQVNNKINFINEKIEDDRVQRYLETARFFKKVLSSHKIIDIGCGTGTGLKSFEEEGFEVTGIEPDSSRARVGRERYGVKIIETTVDEHSLESQTYDIATCLHSLEHFHYPHKIMESITRLVKDGGYVYIEVPDFTGFVTDWNDAILLAHLNNFSENNLILLGLKVGLKPVFRTFPKSSGLTHLGLLFCEDGDNKHRKEKYLESKAVHDQCLYAKSVYSNGLIDNSLKENKVATYNVPQINDISLSYKASLETKALVEDNYLARSIKYDKNSGEFIIKNPSEAEYTKTKEQRAKKGCKNNIIENNVISEIEYKMY